LFYKVDPFIPVGRLAHSSVLVGNKLYFFGGIKNDGVCLNEVFYLDVSKSFNLAVPSWVDLTQNAGIPFKSCWATVSLNDKEQTIYLFGGTMDDLTTNKDAFISNVHSFNLNSLTWNVPNIKGIPPKRRRKVKSVIDDTGKMYIFGGYSDTSSTVFNDMIILDTVELSWSIITPVHAPKRYLYTATLLSNGVIVYIGGQEFNQVNREVDIKQINLFNTKTQTWSVKVCIKIIYIY